MRCETFRAAAAAGVMAAFAWVAAPSGAWAVVFNESTIGDAPETIDDAPDVTGYTEISGSLDPDNGDPADVFCIDLGVGTFFASTVGGANFDTQLFLFEEHGYGVWADDDAAADTLQSTILYDITEAGTYYIAISPFNIDPFLDFGEGEYPMFDDVLYPTGPTIYGSEYELDHWGDGGEDPVYTIFLSPVEVQVPEPATLAIFGLGLAGLGFARRRKAA